MPLGQSPRVRWTTGPVPGPRHGRTRGKPSAWHANTPPLSVPSGHGGASSETGQRQPLLPPTHASARMRGSTRCTVVPWSSPNSQLSSSTTIDGLSGIRARTCFGAIAGRTSVFPGLCAQQGRRARALLSAEAIAQTPRHWIRSQWPILPTLCKPISRQSRRFARLIRPHKKPRPCDPHTRTLTPRGFVQDPPRIGGPSGAPSRAS
jgi:hypothetical protein